MAPSFDWWAKETHRGTPVVIKMQNPQSHRMFNLHCRRRVSAARTDRTTTKNTRFYTCIKIFLWVSILLLGFELAAYFKGWHFSGPDLELQSLYTLTSSLAIKDVFGSIYSKWVSIRVEYLAPPQTPI